MTYALAPGKVILFGEHFVVYGSSAVLCAIQKYVRVDVALQSGNVRIVSRYGDATYSSNDSIDSIPPHDRPIFHITAQCECTADITIKSDIPPGVGLGSSSACCVAAAGAILGDSRPRIIDAALRAERSVFPKASGGDTSASFAGGVIRFTGDAYDRYEANKDLTFVIANTKREHTTADMVAAVTRSKESDHARFAALQERVMQIIPDALCALKSGDLVALGAHMNENHKCLRDVGVSDAAMDKIVAAAAESGYGAKLTGAGGGGCAVALVDKSNMDDTLDAVRSLGVEAFSVQMDSEGLRVVADR